VSPDGRRHVFSHFGAGSFVGAPTYLSRFFIANPLVFAKELKQLNGLGITPQVFLDNRAMLTTPVDVFLNQLAESHRGISRHGSCGLGINETVTRCLRSPELQTRVRDIINPEELIKKIRALSGAGWLHSRLAFLGIDCKSTQWQSVEHFSANLENIILQFIQDSLEMLEHVALASVCPRFDSVVFEGAQGLLLDEDRLDQWPHVTRSKTGLANVVQIANEMAIDELDITYVTRSYLTRHGAGPLVGEEDWSLEDATNVANPYQGVLRFAKLSWNDLEDSIARDIRSCAQKLRARYSVGLAVTCLDQVPMPSGVINLPIRFLSNGPTRLHVRHSNDQYNKRICPSAPFVALPGLQKRVSA
jgi:adenylosuccinate synthase